MSVAGSRSHAPSHAAVSRVAASEHGSERSHRSGHSQHTIRYQLSEHSHHTHKSEHSHAGSKAGSRVSYREATVEEAGSDSGSVAPFDSISQVSSKASHHEDAHAARSVIVNGPPEVRPSDSVSQVGSVTSRSHAPSKHSSDHSHVSHTPSHTGSARLTKANLHAHDEEPRVVVEKIVESEHRSEHLSRAGTERSVRSSQRGRLLEVEESSHAGSHRRRSVTPSSRASTARPPGGSSTGSYARSRASDSLDRALAEAQIELETLSRAHSKAGSAVGSHAGSRASHAAERAVLEAEIELASSSRSSSHAGSAVGSKAGSRVSRATEREVVEAHIDLETSSHSLSRAGSAVGSHSGSRAKSEISSRSSHHDPTPTPSHAGSKAHTAVESSHSETKVVEEVESGSRSISSATSSVPYRTILITPEKLASRHRSSPRRNVIEVPRASHEKESPRWLRNEKPARALYVTHEPRREIFRAPSPRREILRAPSPRREILRAVSPRREPSHTSSHRSAASVSSHSSWKESDFSVEVDDEEEQGHDSSVKIRRHHVYHCHEH